MLSLVNRGKAEPKSTASATNEFFYAGESKDRRKFIVDYLQNPSKRVNNMIQRMTLRYIYMELYHRIVKEVEKVSPNFASRIQRNNGRYIFIAQAHAKWLIEC